LSTTITTSRDNFKIWGHIHRCPRASNKSNGRAPSFAKVNPVPIPRSPESEDFQNLTGTSLFKDTSTIKFHEQLISFSRWVTLWENVRSRNVEKSF